VGWALSGLTQKLLAHWPGVNVSMAELRT